MLRTISRILFHPRVVFLWVVAFLCLAAKENYPFSDFPMYSNFSDSTYMVYVTDGEGEAIPLFDSYGMRTSILKKIYNGKAKARARDLGIRMRELTSDDLAEAGRHALESLVAFRNDMGRDAAPYRTLKIVHLWIDMENDEIRRTRVPVATLDLP